MSDMSLVHSRPTEPKFVPYDTVPYLMWGDDRAGHVIDWMYPTSDKLHFTMFALRPGTHWEHSENFFPCYGADEGFYVLKGSFTLHNPETGEVVVANQGEALHLRKHTWHYGYNFTQAETVVVEAFAPVPPLEEFNVPAMNRAAPPLSRVLGGQYDLMDDWPRSGRRAAENKTLWALRPDEWLHIIQGKAAPVRVSLFVATDKLTMGYFSLLPGVIADPETHPGDECALVVSGRVYMRVAGIDEMFEMKERDCFFIPEGVEHQYYNLSDQPAAVVFGVAPLYR